jgi:hypothetical protein
MSSGVEMHVSLLGNASEDGINYLILERHGLVRDNKVLI